MYCPTKFSCAAHSSRFFIALFFPSTLPFSSFQSKTTIYIKTCFKPHPPFPLNKPLFFSILPLFSIIHSTKRKAALQSLSSTFPLLQFKNLYILHTATFMPRSLIQDPLVCSTSPCVLKGRLEGAFSFP